MIDADMDVDDLECNLESAADVARELITQKLQTKNRDLTSRLNRTLRELALSQDRYEFLLGLQGVPTARKFAKLQRSNSRSSAVILGVMDWHVEERVDPSLIGGINEYNPTIAAARIKHMFEKAVYLLDFIRGVAKVDQVVLAVLGDLINGYIHEEFIENNYLSPTEASLLAQDCLHSGIQHLLKAGKIKSILVCCCHGNHGRTTPNRLISTGHQNSFEWALYHQMARQYRNDPRVAWKIENGMHNWVEIEGQQVRFHHGDNIKYSGGVGGITVPVTKKLSQWNRVKRADLDLFGHYHQFVDHWNWVCSGSVVGYNAYAMSIGAEYQPPSQTMILLDRRFGKCLTLPVFCEA